LLIPFSVMWAGFAVFWEVSIVKEDAPLFMKLWGIPFLAAGAYLLVGRFLIDARARRRTVYGVTPERVLVIGGLLRTVVHSYPLRELGGAQLEEYDDGAGTIVLMPTMIPSVWLGRGAGWGVWQGWSPYRLERVAEAKRIYDLVLRDAEAVPGPGKRP